MNSAKNYSRVLGVLFLVPLLTYATGSNLISALTDQPQYLSVLVEHKTQIVTGALLMVLNSTTVITIGVILFPALEAWNKRVALGYLSVRILEALILTVGILCLLLLVVISETFVATAPEDQDYLKTLALLAQKANFWAYQFAMIVLGSGSIALCYLFCQSAFVPFWLSIAGMAGYFLLLVGSVAELLDFPIGLWMSIPGGIFEITFGFWLLVKAPVFPLPSTRQAMA